MGKKRWSHEPYFLGVENRGGRGRRGKDRRCGARGSWVRINKVCVDELSPVSVLYGFESGTRLTRQHLVT